MQCSREEGTLQKQSHSPQPPVHSSVYSSEPTGLSAYLRLYLHTIWKETATMKFSYTCLALLLFCLCLGSAWGYMEDSARHDFSHHGHASLQGRYGTYNLNRLMRMLAAQQAAARASQSPGASLGSIIEQDQCKSVVASPHPATVTKNTAVHLCRNGMHACVSYVALYHLCISLELHFL